MARNACRTRQVVVVVDVAIGTCSGRTACPPVSGKSHRIVIKLRIQPVIRAVALFARSRESESDVIRGRRILSLPHGRNSTSWTWLESAVGRVLVAGVAIHGRVSARQREAIVVLLKSP